MRVRGEREKELLPLSQTKREGGRMDNSGHRVSPLILSQREEIKKRIIAKGEMEEE